MRKNYDDDFNNFSFKHLDEMIEKFFGNISKLPNLGDTNPNTHHHSISYRFGAGMDKPEIRLNGEKVENEDLNDLFENMKTRSGSLPSKINLNPAKSMPELDVKDVSIPESQNHLVPQYEDTYFEVDHDGGACIVTIELPGVEKDQIRISQSGNTVTIIGENELIAYKAEFQLDFEYTNTEIEGKNSIYQVRLTK